VLTRPRLIGMGKTIGGGSDGEGADPQLHIPSEPRPRETTTNLIGQGPVALRRISARREEKSGASGLSFHVCGRGNPALESSNQGEPDHRREVSWAGVRHAGAKRKSTCASWRREKVDRRSFRSTDRFALDIARAQSPSRLCANRDSRLRRDGARPVLEGSIANRDASPRAAFPRLGARRGSRTRGRVSARFRGFSKKSEQPLNEGRNTVRFVDRSSNVIWRCGVSLRPVSGEAIRLPSCRTAGGAGKDFFARAGSAQDCRSTLASDSGGTGRAPPPSSAPKRPPGSAPAATRSCLPTARRSRVNPSLYKIFYKKLPLRPAEGFCRSADRPSCDVLLVVQSLFITKAGPSVKEFIAEAKREKRPGKDQLRLGRARLSWAR